MLKLIKKLIGDKKQYKEQLQRIGKLPADYRFVFEKIESYIWSFASGDGSDTLNALEDLILLFESSAADGKHVLDITGDDVIGFCDIFFSDTKKWTDNIRKKLNRDIMNKLGEPH